MSTLQRAIEIAQDAHKGATDKQGKPYIDHPLAVAALVPTEELKIIAMLHDVMEEDPCNYNKEKFRIENFSEAIINALICLTRVNGVNYWDYIRRVADDDLAIEVKLADLTHNSDRSRIPNPTKEDEARWEKYRKATKYLTDVKSFKAGNPNTDLTKEPFKYILHRMLYAVLRFEYVLLCETIMHVLESMSKSVCPTAIIQGRAKNLDSFTEKCIRKAQKYKQSHFKMMTRKNRELMQKLKIIPIT